MSDALPPTRTPAFEARLRKRYAAEKRFRVMGLGAILFSVAVLLFLLVSMTLNGIGGFQRVTVQVPIHFGEVGMVVPAGVTDRAVIVRSLESQGLPNLVEFSAQAALGNEGAKQINPDAWRIVADRVAADPALMLGEPTIALPVSDDLASALPPGLALIDHGDHLFHGRSTGTRVFQIPMV